MATLGVFWNSESIRAVRVFFELKLNFHEFFHERPVLKPYFVPAAGQ
jgi:hypothetical protein